MKKRVLFICTHNAARSQMAEGLLRARYGDWYEAFSAGTEPGAVHPHSVAVMREIGIDITGQRSKSIAEMRGRYFDYVVTVCERAQEACPFFPGDTVLHESFADPTEQSGNEERRLAQFRTVRDRLASWIETTFGNGKPAG
jgi:arsenate reductase